MKIKTSQFFVILALGLLGACGKTAPTAPTGGPIDGVWTLVPDARPDNQMEAAAAQGERVTLALNNTTGTFTAVGRQGCTLTVQMAVSYSGNQVTLKPGAVQYSSDECKKDQSALETRTFSFVLTGNSLTLTDTKDSANSTTFKKN